MKEMVGRALLCRGDARKGITVVLAMTEASTNINHN